MYFLPFWPYTQTIISDDSRTPWVPVFLDVNKGSVLGPLLFILYTADTISKAYGHWTSFSDDVHIVQAYVHNPPSQLLLVSRIDDLSHELHLGMSSNRLSLDSSKTQLL